MNGVIGARVIVIGPSCSGKSTVGERIARMIGARHTELDGLNWEPNWTPAASEVFRERVRQTVAADTWVLSGSYIGQQQDVSWPRADTVIWLDLPAWVTLPRIVTRSWRRWRRGDVLWGSNHERFWPQLKIWDKDDSLLAYSMWTFRARRRRDFAQLSDPRWAHIRFFRFGSTREVNQWLRAVRAGTLATRVD